MGAILVLGGVGFIGRNLAVHLIESLPAETKIRIVDKALPATAYLTAAQRAAVERCEFKQANLSLAASLEKAFEPLEGGAAGGAAWDAVINLAAETKYSQSDEVYAEQVEKLSLNAARIAAARGCGIYIEVSTAMVYDADKKPSKEDGKLKPWTGLAKAKLRVEEGLRSIPNLRYVVLRPALVYGVGDSAGLMPRLVVAAVYKQLKEDMKLLWTKDLRLNTVHVTDVCRAIGLLVARAAAGNAPPTGSVYNLADENDTDQGKLNALIERLFGIKTGFYGTIVSNLAKINLESATEDSNEKHLAPWSELCAASTPPVVNSPLTPYLDMELLYNNSLSVDGSRICRELGFAYSVKTVSEYDLREQINSWIELRCFPSGLV